MARMVFCGSGIKKAGSDVRLYKLRLRADLNFLAKCTRPIPLVQPFVSICERARNNLFTDRQGLRRVAM